MSQKTIYTCDKCKAEQVTLGEWPEQWWTVTVAANCANYTDTRYSSAHVNIQVCRPCLELFGIHVSKRPDSIAPAPKLPTIEELIVEIVQRSIPS